MVKNRSLPTQITAATAFAACSLASLAAPRAYGATELARVNSTVITLEDFNRKYQDNLKYFQFKAPSRKSVLDDLVKRELGVQEAKREGLDRDPAVVERMNVVLFQALLEKKLSKEIDAIKVSDEDAEAYYAKNPEIRTSHIFVSVPAGAKPADEKKAYDRIAKIQKDYLADGKMGFAEVAQHYSDGVAAPMGGDIEYQTKDKLDPKYYEAALALKTPGRVSGIVRTQFGYHIIKLTAVRPWDEADKALTKRLVFEERRTQLFDRYVNQLKTQARVSTHPELLKD